MTREELIRITQEVAILLAHDRHQDAATRLERFVELVAAAERDKHDIGTHTCSNRCQRYACVAVREAVRVEREACAKVCDDNYFAFMAADAIRARGEV